MKKEIKIKNIIFDFDGVLIENSQDLLEHYRKYVKYISYEDYLDYNRVNILKKGDAEHKNGERDKFYIAWGEFFKKSKMEVSAIELVKELQENSHNLFIVTSNREINIKNCLKNSGLGSGIFKEILTEEYHHCKTEKINDIHEKYDLKKEESILVTDTLGDVKEGNKAGVEVWGVTFGVHSEEILREGRVGEIINNWQDFEEKIRARN